MGSFDDILNRELSCDLCRLISQRLRQRRLFGTAGWCEITNTYFCSTGADVVGPRLTQQAYQDTLGNDRNAEKKRVSTSRLRIIALLKDNDAIGRSGTGVLVGATLLSLHPCSEVIPTTLTATDSRLPMIRPSTSHSGRLLDGTRANLRLVKSWLARCEEDHGPSCHVHEWIRHLQPPIGLILIDVHNECITPAPGTARYAVLSYVWGQCGHWKLTNASVQGLQQQDALLQRHLPNTIRDAISVTRAMGLDYLWVDALCIRQDDGRHVQDQISQMASIYANAVVTIVAAAGNDADAGLSGVRKGSRVLNQEVIDLPCGKVISVQDSNYAPVFRLPESEYSVWYTRAWTLQEQIFSRRKLIFAKDQIYWICSEAKWLEEVELEFDSLNDFLGYAFGNAPYGPGQQYDFRSNGTLGLGKGQLSFKEIAHSYSTRRLGNENDRLNAFLGISTSMSLFGSTAYVWGLPQRTFAQSLLWRFEDSSPTRATHTYSLSDGSTVSVPIPSWSWLSRTGNRDLRLAEGLFEAELEIYHFDTKGRCKIKQEHYNPWPSRVLQARKPLGFVWQGTRGFPDYTDAPLFDVTLHSGEIRFFASTSSLYLMRNTIGTRSNICYEVIDASVYSDGLVKDYGGRITQNHMGSTSHIQKNDPDIARRLPHIIKQAKATQTQHNDIDVIEVDFVIIGRGPCELGFPEQSDDLFALVVEWRGDVAYRLGTARIAETNWIRLKNRAWRLVTLG